MHVLVSPGNSVALLGTDDFKSMALRVEAGVSREDLARALQEIVELEGEDHGWILESWLLAQLQSQPPRADWRAAFDTMVRYAELRGWVRENPRSIRAHVVVMGAGAVGVV